MVACPLADGLVAFSCSQGVSEPVSWVQVLLLMVLWHFSALSQSVTCFMAECPLADGLVTFSCS